MYDVRPRFVEEFVLENGDQRLEAYPFFLLIEIKNQLIIGLSLEKPAMATPGFNTI